MSSGRNVTLALIITWVMFMRGSFKSGVEAIFEKDPMSVIIRNDLTTDLTLGCHSSDDNLGDHTLKTNGTFEFNFRPNFFCSTKFECYFTWINNGISTRHDHFLIYKCKRDGSRCHSICLWGINATQATQYGPEDNVEFPKIVFKKGYPW
jgi:hypothetical protein